MCGVGVGGGVEREMLRLRLALTGPSILYTVLHRSIMNICGNHWKSRLFGIFDLLKEARCHLEKMMAKNRNKRKPRGFVKQ